MLRTPLRNNPSAHHEPTPPIPKMSTRADCNFSRLSFPKSSSVRRCIPCSIVVILSPILSEIIVIFTATFLFLSIAGAKIQYFERASKKFLLFIANTYLGLSIPKGLMSLTVSSLFHHIFEM
jgi:hypothetical protein